LSRRGGLQTKRLIHLRVNEVANACHVPEVNTFEISVLLECSSADHPLFMEVELGLTVETTGEIDFRQRVIGFDGFTLLSTGFIRAS
jgi:hypothetical protein